MAIKNGTKLTWPTKNRWGKSKKSGKVVGFVARGKSALKQLDDAKRKAFRGKDVNTINDRYLVQDEKGRITAPRAPTLDRNAKSK